VINSADNVETVELDRSTRKKHGRVVTDVKKLYCTILQCEGYTGSEMGSLRFNVVRIEIKID